MSAFSHLLLAPVGAAEKRLLARLLSFDEPPAGPSTEAAPADPAAFRELAAAHRLDGVLAWAARRDPALALRVASDRPDWPEERLAILAAEAAVLQEETDAVLERLAAAGIEAFRLKGIHLARRAYPDPALRPMKDVDLLVAPADLEPAFAALRAAGLAVVPDQERHGPSTSLHAEQLAAPGSGVVFELHHQVARGFDLPFLARHGAGPAGGELPPHVHLAHRLLDIAKDGYVRGGLLPYLDLLRLARAFPGLAPQAAWELVEAVGLAGFAGASLWHFEHLCEELSLAAPWSDRRLRPRASLPRSLAARWYARGDALFRQRYTPRWQRRALRAVFGGVQ